MPEVIGVCKKADEDAIWIEDYDGDDIEMSMEGLQDDWVRALVCKGTEFLGKDVSYYYDAHQISLRLIDRTLAALGFA